MHQNGMHTEVSSEGGRTTIRHTMVHPYPVPRQLSESTLANLLVIARRLTGIEFRPLELWIAHPSPTSTVAHQSLFGCPIRWRAPDDRIVIDSALLAAPLSNANPALVAVLEAHARDLITRLSEGVTFADQVRTALCSELPRGTLSLPNLARCMGTSRRTLQRKLAAEGTSTAELVDDVRRELSIVYLQQAQLGIADIALLVGFSDERAFRRAFRRWLGTSPSQFRSSQRTP
jgi:AraC-like DNA-binding protein